MDIHRPYRAAVDAVFPVPRPTIVHDHFHVVAQMDEALKEVRSEEAGGFRATVARQRRAKMRCDK